MEFAAPAWDPYRVKDNNKLEMLQCHAACLAKSAYRCTTSVSKLMDDLVGEPSQIAEKELV